MAAMSSSGRPPPGGDTGPLLHDDATAAPAVANPAAPTCPAAAALAQHMDSEDRRVKELTEGILYELLPAALQVMLPACEDPLQELDAQRCRAVAGAALAASSLMNAPPGFLEFLLCIPWRNLPQLYPAALAQPGAAAAAAAAVAVAAAGAKGAEQPPPQQQQQGSEQDRQQPQQEQQDQQALLLQCAVDAAERQLLVNLPLHPQLVQPLLQFMYRPQHADSVPPLLRPDYVRRRQRRQRQQQQPLAPPPPLQPASQQSSSSSSGMASAGSSSEQAAAAAAAAACSADAELLEAAAAVLDGATPLHCAALRGNPAQVDHLLFCGADPTLRTAAGELALQLVPVCGGLDRTTRSRVCHCLGPAEQEVWECRSRISRMLISRKALLALRGGLAHYLSLLWLCFLLLLGLATSANCLQRPVLQAHVRRRREQRRQAAHSRTCAALDAMRQEASMGHAHLATAKQQAGAHHHADAAGTCSSTAEAAAIEAAQAVDPLLVGGVFESEALVVPAAAAAGDGAGGRGAAAAAAAGSAGDAAAQEPVAPSTPSAADEAAACHAAPKHRRSSSGTALWAAAAAAAAGGGHLDEDGQRLSRDSSRAACDLYSRSSNSSSSSSSNGGAAAATGAAAAEHQQPLAAAAGHPTPAADGSPELAFKCFVRAVHALQSLDLQEGCMPRALQAGQPAGLPGAAPAAVNGSVHGPVTADATAAGRRPSSSPYHQQVPRAAAAAPPPGPAAAAAPSLSSASSTSSASAADSLDQLAAEALCVMEDEQADLYCCWAEAVLLKHNACACAGCTLLAVNAIRMAHVAAVRLFNCVHKQRQQAGLSRRWHAVGRALSRIVYAHIALLCRIEGGASPCKASVWRAQQCLREWDKLAAAGLAGGPDQQEAAAALTPGSTHEQVVDQLRLWSRMAESDLIISEALLGSSLAPLTTLDAALAAALLTPPPATPCSSSSSSCGADSGGASTATAAPQHGCGSDSSRSPVLPVLARPVSAALLEQLQTARGLALCPSPAVKQLAAQVTEATARELSAGARLRELLAGHTPPSTPEGVAALAAAIAAATPFASLAADVEAARALHAQSCAKAEVAAQLQAVVDEVAAATSIMAVASSSGGGGSGDGGGQLPLRGYDAERWQQCVGMLEAAADTAKDANVGVTRARKLMKELQAQMAAAEAAAAIDAVLARRPCGSAPLKAALSKAEAAAAAISNSCASSAASSRTAAAAAGGGGGASQGSVLFSELLVSRLQCGKKRLEVERAAEALHKASLAYRSVGDLPKLEAAVLNARKVGAEELAPEEYRAASELRGRLTSAARVKAQLEGALKALLSVTLPGAGPRGRALEQLAEPVEAAIREAARWDELLPGEAGRASEALEAWRSSTACEAKLSRALRDGCSSAALARVISEAAAAGVKVASAKRVLKLQQLLEAAMATAGESAASAGAGSSYSQLAAKLEAAETGGVAPAVLQPGKQLLRQLLAVDARQALEAALKPHSDWSANTRIATLRAALDKVEDALGCTMQQLQDQVHEQQQQQQPADVHHQQPDQAAPQEAAAKEQQQQQQQVAAAGQLSAGKPSSGSVASSVASSKPVSKGGQHQALLRSDSIASSSACSEASSSLAAVGSGGLLPSSCCLGGEGSEVVQAVQDLALRAWQLLQQDQQQLEELERERLEQERARRERERQERQRAEAERAERGKGERDKAAAERKAARARATAERSKAFTVVWGSSAGGGSGSSAAAPSGGGRGNGSKGRDATRRSSSTGTGGQQSGKGGGAAAKRAGSAAAAAGASPRPASAPGSGVPAVAAAGDIQPGSSRAPSGAWAKQAQVGHAALAGVPAAWSVARQHSADAAEAFDSAASHARCDSYDILGDVNSKLGQDMLALLELPEALHQHSAAPSAADGMGAAADASAEGLVQHDATQQQQQQQPGRPSLSLQLPGGAPAPAAAAAGGIEDASVALDSAPAPTSRPPGSSSSSNRQYNFLDLGGSSWLGSSHPASAAAVGAVGTAARPPSLAGAGASAALDFGSQLAVGDGGFTASQGGGAIVGSLDSNSGSRHTGLWRSALGLGLDSPSLPPIAPRGTPLRLVGSGQRSLTEDGSGLQQQQQGHASSFPELLPSSAGRVSPTGAADGPLQQLQLPEPALLHHSFGGALGLSSPGLLPDQYGGAGLDAGGQGWLLQHHQQQQVMAAAAADAAASAAAAVAMAAVAGSQAHTMGLQGCDFLQQQQQQQQQYAHLQFLQQQQDGHMLPSALGGFAAPGDMSGAASSFAFGAPGLQAFSSGFHTAALPGHGSGGHDGSGQQHAGGGGEGASRGPGYLQLPDNLNFSPPSPGPAGRLLGQQ